MPARLACPRCTCVHETPVCPYCGRDRTATLTTTEEPDDAE